jgi:hypothetical protein
MWTLNRKGFVIHYQVCDACKTRIYGRVYDYKGIWIVIAKKKVVGVCIGMAWMEYFNCLLCWRKTHDADRSS